MTDPKDDLEEARLMLGREAARHGNWSGEQHAAAAKLVRELASLDQANIKTVSVTAELGTHLGEPHVLRFAFEGDLHVVVSYKDGQFVASDPATTRPAIDIDLDFNAYTQLFETHESDPAHPGARRSAASLIIKKAIQQLHGA